MTTLSPDSKPGSLSVQMYEYQEPSSLELVESHTSTHCLPNQPTMPGDFDQRLGEAHAQGVREGMMKAQHTLGKDLANERATIAANVQTFEKQMSAYYARVEVKLVHLALAIAADRKSTRLN